MDFMQMGDVALEREEVLAALPALFTFARQAVIAAFEPGDAEAEILRALLDECVVGAHRLALRERSRLAFPSDAQRR
jgi:hypothetical protein